MIRRDVGIVTLKGTNVKQLKPAIDGRRDRDVPQTESKSNLRARINQCALSVEVRDTSPYFHFTNQHSFVRHSSINSHLRLVSTGATARMTSAGATHTGENTARILRKPSTIPLHLSLN